MNTITFKISCSCLVGKMASKYLQRWPGMSLGMRRGWRGRRWAVNRFLLPHICCKCSRPFSQSGNLQAIKFVQLARVKSQKDLPCFPYKKTRTFEVICIGNRGIYVRPKTASTSTQPKSMAQILPVGNTVRKPGTGTRGTVVSLRVQLKVWFNSNELTVVSHNSFGFRSRQSNHFAIVVFVLGAFPGDPILRELHGGGRAIVATWCSFWLLDLSWTDHKDNNKSSNCKELHHRLQPIQPWTLNYCIDHRYEKYTLSLEFC